MNEITTTLSQPTGVRMSQAQKAEVIALLLAGVSVKEISKELNISTTSIYKVKKKYEDAQYDGAIQDINKNLGAYIANSLKHHLDGLNKIARLANEEDYIKGQSARDLAELHKQLEHWTVSILSATNTLNQISEYQESLKLQAKTKK